MSSNIRTTLLIYMAADNNLEDHAQEDLDRIIEGSRETSMKIVLQYDAKRYVDAPDTLRLFIENGELVKEEELGELNTGDPAVLREFIKISSDYYPADKTILIIWSHGSGVDDRDIYAKDKNRERYFVPTDEIEEIAVGFDDTSGDFLDNLELQKALDGSVKIDLLGFDACLMGMFEIAYQLRHQTKVMVASQHLEPASGWDYPRILNELNAKKTAVEMGKNLIKFHDEHHAYVKQDVTQSALDITVIEEVAKNLDAYALILREELKSGDPVQRHKDLKYTLENSQYFERDDYVDLIDFIHKVQNRLEIDVLIPYADKLLESLGKFIVANHAVGYFMEDANGVSIYFPNSSRPFKETFEMYEKLDFIQAYPNWVKLLKWYWL